MEPLTWSEVAIGMMVGLRGIGDAPPIPRQPTRGRAELEARLLQLGQQTWMPQVPGLALLLLADCPGAPRPGPAWLLRPLPAGGPQVRWECYARPAKVGVSLWRKTAALLRALWDAYGASVCRPRRSNPGRAPAGRLCLPLTHVRAAPRASGASFSRWTRTPS